MQSSKAKPSWSRPSSSRLSRRLTADERTSILRRFKSASQDHLLLARSQAVSRSNPQLLRRPISPTSERLVRAKNSATGGGWCGESTGTYNSQLGQSNSFSQPRTSHAAASSATPAQASASGSSPVFAARGVLRHNKSEPAIYSLVQTRAYASAMRRTDASPLKFAAIRAMSRRKLSPSSAQSSSSRGSTSSLSSSATPDHHTSVPAQETSSQSGPNGDDGLPQRQSRLSWLSPEDVGQRKQFLEALIQQGLPLPRSELDYHAARVYIDSEDRSVYDIEQWTDYIQLTNRFTPPPAKGGGGGAGHKDSSERSSSGKQAKEQWIDTPKCELCGTNFWILKKRHHCRSCGRCVCWQCSQEKFVLRGLYDNKPVRTCSECFAELENELLEETRYYIDLVRQLQHRIDSVMAASSSAASPEETRPQDAVMDEYLKLGQSIMQEIGDLESLHQRYWLRSHRPILLASDNQEQARAAWPSSYACSSSPKAALTKGQPAVSNSSSLREP